MYSKTKKQLAVKLFLLAVTGFITGKYGSEAIMGTLTNLELALYLPIVALWVYLMGYDLLVIISGYITARRWRERENTKTR